MIKRFLIFFLLEIACVNLQAQTSSAAAADSAKLIVQSADSLQQEVNDDEAAAEVFPTDTFLFIHPILIAPDTIALWKKKTAFAYIKNLDSLLKAFQDKEKNAAAIQSTGPRNSFMDNLLNAPALKLFFWLLAVIFIGVIVYHLLKNKVFFQMTSSSSNAAEIAEDENELRQTDYDKLINQSCKAADYRLAVRYLFLKTLQQLNYKNLVIFAPEKTNSRYVQELPQQWRNDFSKLIIHYEYVWYGNFAVSKEQYETVQQRYSAFLQKI